MVDLAEIQVAYYIVAATGVIGALLTAVVGVKSYINSNKRTQETRDRELETRQAQLFMSSMFDRLSSPEASKAESLLVPLRPKTVEDLQQIFDNQELYTAWQTVWWAYEGLGVLVHEGLVDIRLVARYMGGTYKAEWEKWGPVYQLFRVAINSPRMCIECEYLYDKLIEFGRLNPEYHIIDSHSA